MANYRNQILFGDLISLSVFNYAQKENQINAGFGLLITFYFIFLLLIKNRIKLQDNKIIIIESLKKE